jgi:hypothetical protein
MSQLRERYHFIHNVFANFFKDMLDWLSTGIYPRFEYRVVGTYDKAVEYIQKQCQYGRETDMPYLPALILNPTGDFLPADGNAGGKQLWRYPNLAPTLSKRLFDPIYRDEQVLMYPGFLRMKGEVELIMLCNSFYEYCDIRMLFINMFGGLDRIIYPKFFSSFIILPQSFLDYTYTNPYTGQTYQIDWTSANASERLVRSTATNELVLPLNIKPEITLTGLSDASNRYGGADNIAEWKLNATINYELEMPTYMVIESDYLAQGIDLEIRYESVYSMYNDYQPPENRWLTNFRWDWGLESETNSDNLCYLDPADATNVMTYVGHFKYKIRYFHEVTQNEIDSTSNITISLPEQITFPRALIVNSKYGTFAYGDHYWITDNGWTLVIRNDTTDLEAGMVLELYVYEKSEDS